MLAYCTPGKRSHLWDNRGGKIRKQQASEEEHNNQRFIFLREESTVVTALNFPVAAFH